MAFGFCTLDIEPNLRAREVEAIANLSEDGTTNPASVMAFSIQEVNMTHPRSCHFLSPEMRYM
jgi:hypothetical protein